MNKIIATSLLLFAGTALSQATTVVWAIGISSSTTTPYYYETEGSGYTVIQYSNGDSNNTAIPTTLLTSSSQDGYTLGYQNSSAGRYWGSSAASGDYSGELAWALHNVTGLSYSTLNTLLDSYTGAYCGAGGTLTLTFSGLTDGQTYTVALVTSNNSGTGALSLGSGGTITSAYYGTVGVDSWNEATISSDNINITTSNSSFTAVCLTFTATSDSVTFNSTNKGGFALAAITTETVAIPEPSAFGLLAGLGALALVVSRRRRRRSR